MTTRRLSDEGATIELMDHDPLCLHGETGLCACVLIARVRADEKAKWTHVCSDNNCCHQSGDI